METPKLLDIFIFSTSQSFWWFGLHVPRPVTFLASILGSIKPFFKKRLLAMEIKIFVLTHGLELRTSVCDGLGMDPCKFEIAFVKLHFLFFKVRIILVGLHQGWGGKLVVICIE